MLQNELENLLGHEVTYRDQSGTKFTGILQVQNRMLGDYLLVSKLGGVVIACFRCFGVSIEDGIITDNNWKGK